MHVFVQISGQVLKKGLRPKFDLLVQVIDCKNFRMFT